MWKAFEMLKATLPSPPLVEIPDLEKAFVVETDASSVAVGAVSPPLKKDKRVHSIR